MAGQEEEMIEVTSQILLRSLGSARNCKIFGKIFSNATRLSIAQTWKLKAIPNDEVIIIKNLHCTELDSLTLELKERDTSDVYEIWKKTIIGRDTKRSQKITCNLGLSVVMAFKAHSSDQAQ
ncbi:hypothetical protein L345_09421, partial [Ophiophagus hannah]